MTGYWELSSDEYATLAAALDALLPPEGHFPAPSTCRAIEDFILVHVPPPGGGRAPYPGLDASDIRELVGRLAGHEDMTAALERLEQDDPDRFQALWALAVYGYYSRPEVTAAIQAELAPGYHGAPLPLGYAHLIAPWNPDDPLQLPRNPAGSYIPTAEVRPVDLATLREPAE